MRASPRITGGWLTQRRVAALAVLLAAPASAPSAAWGDYAEAYQERQATRRDTSEMMDLSTPPYNVPAKAILEVALRNDNGSADPWGGVCAVG